MAPRLRSAARQEEATAFSRLVALYREYEPLGWRVLPWLLLVTDLLLSVLIVKRVPYTEIDWVAYMQEVAGFLEEGETNYLNLRGDTGPLVYPGGFVWIFSALYKLTDKGKDLRLAQWIFVGVYLATLLLVLKMYQKGRLAPLWALPCLVLSKRVHSIFMLRMFNDGVAMLLAYAAVLLFMHRKWAPGCVLYSLAVSVKMNVLLFAPGLALLLLQALGWAGAAAHIFLCGVVQLIVAYPFLYHHPIPYLTKAFELSRVFMYEWTVNFRFLDEKVFLSKPLALGLLLGMALVLLAFAGKWLRETKTSASSLPVKGALSPRYITLTLLLSNFIGVAFARTLHYQFYCWYFHALPALAFAAPALLPHATLKLLVLAGVEFAFNVFPSTAPSSLVLQACHLWLLASLYLSPAPEMKEPKGSSKRI